LHSSKKISNCISVKERETTHLLRLPRDFLQYKIQSWSLLLIHKEVFGHDSFKPNVRQSIFIHYTYATFYACSFPHHNVHIHIKYISLELVVYHVQVFTRLSLHQRDFNIYDLGLRQRNFSIYFCLDPFICLFWMLTYTSPMICKN